MIEEYIDYRSNNSSLFLGIIWLVIYEASGLDIPKFFVCAVFFCQELVMASFLDDLSIFHDDDPVHLHDG